MSKDLRDEDCLEHILQAIGRINRYVADGGEHAFLQDEKTQDAVIRNLEIIAKTGLNSFDDHAGHIDRLFGVPVAVELRRDDRLQGIRIARLDIVEIEQLHLLADIPERGIVVGSHLAEAKDGVGEDQFLSLVEEVSLEGLRCRLLGEETAGVLLTRA
jgi:hypothetical protein